ncbi:ACP phosphodiesterase [Oceanicoccus sp. KOV_DT_Chl]|uniref:acyl carrier protein phosphodiesterase n=1 Tax=Oceanicoccus sp. KOV_DT_Chl TaxID=1904639 RepID=UPI000C7CFC9B|nr:ACP phosphodiesterase [Oceanicoccus sp. KOV_DT_Chl]
MNYLAHFHLSHGDDELLLGALLGDFIKGPLKGERSPGLEQGILLHRKIDAYTDQHSLPKQAQQLFAPEFRRYSGIMTDVVFDHFLNQHWHLFHHQPLTTFSQQVYQLIVESTHLTAAAQQQANNLARYDVFENYKHWQTVAAALQRIGQRIKRDNPLALAAEEMEQHYPALEQIFLEFYPQLQSHAQQIKKEFNQLSR